MGARRQAKKELAKERELEQLREKQRLKDQKRAQLQAQIEQRKVLRQAKLDRMESDERREFLRKERIRNLIVGAVLVVGVGGCIGLVAATDDNDKDDSPSALSADGETSSEDRDYEAFEICKDFVKDRLKAPGSAEFRNFFEDDGEVAVTGSGSGPYTVVSSVDSENSFGASLRIGFTCTVTYVGDDRWRLVDVSLDE